MKGTWERVAEKAAFSPRDTAEGVLFRGALWLSNGYYHGNVLSRDLWRSTDAVHWEKVLDDTPYDGYSEMTVFREKLWAAKNSLWNSEDGLRWNRVLEKTPFESPGYGELLVHRRQLWYLGAGPDIWRSPDGLRWERVLPEAPYGNRIAGAVTVFRGQIYLMGGYTPSPNPIPEKSYPQFTTFSDVWRSRDGVRWERLVERAPWAPRMWAGVAVFDRRLWVIGGFDNVHGRNLDDVWTSEDGATWELVEARERFTARHEPTVYVFKNQLWVIAGNTWPVVNDVWRWRSER